MARIRALSTIVANQRRIIFLDIFHPYTSANISPKI
jgi:hypothetical protein